MPNGRHSRSFITERIDVKGLETRTSLIQETNCHENIKTESFSLVQGTNWFKSSQSDPPSSLWQVKVNKQVTPNSKSSHNTKAIISQLIDLIKAADYFWKLSGWKFTSEMNEWMMKTQTAMKSHQISYLKPMDWARLETFRGERIPRSGRNLGGASVRFFFS